MRVRRHEYTKGGKVNTHSRLDGIRPVRGAGPWERSRWSLVFLLAALSGCTEDTPGAPVGDAALSDSEGTREDGGDSGVPLDSELDGASDAPRPCVDRDHDGFGEGCAAGADCRDDDPRIHPEGLEICNGTDDDCDGLTDESDPFATERCTLSVAGCEFAGRSTCADGARRCYVGEALMPGTFPDVAALDGGRWAVAALGPGGPASPPGMLQVHVATLSTEGELQDIPVALSASESRAPLAPRVFALHEDVAVVFLGPEQRRSAQMALMLGRLSDRASVAQALADPVDAIPLVVRPSVAGSVDGELALLFWDGQSGEEAVRFVRPGGVAQGVAGGVVQWADLGGLGEGFELVYVRPGFLHRRVLDRDGHPAGPEEVLEERAEIGFVRLLASTSGNWVAWTAQGSDPGSVQLNLTSFGPVTPPTSTLIDESAQPERYPALADPNKRLLLVWARGTPRGPELVAYEPGGGSMPVVLGPGDAPSLTTSQSGVGLVFDGGGRVHFVGAACQSNDDGVGG